MVVIYLYTGLTTGKIGITGNVYNTGRGNIKAKVRIKVQNTGRVYSTGRENIMVKVIFIVRFTYR